MALKLADLTFETKGATLFASVSDPCACDSYNTGPNKELHWSLSIDFEESEIDGRAWSPRIYHESLRLPIRRWMDIAGQSVAWDSARDEISSEPNGGFYVFEHGDIQHASLRFLERDGTDFRLEWEGVCDVFWNEKYRGNVPFFVQAVARFTHVVVDGTEHDDDKSLRKRFSQYLDPDDFIQNPIQQQDFQYQNGLEATECMFEPKL